MGADVLPRRRLYRFGPAASDSAARRPPSPGKRGSRRRARRTARARRRRDGGGVRAAAAWPGQRPGRWLRRSYPNGITTRVILPASDRDSLKRGPTVSRQDVKQRGSSHYFEQRAHSDSSRRAAPAGIGYVDYGPLDLLHDHEVSCIDIANIGSAEQSKRLRFLGAEAVRRETVRAAVLA